MRGCHNFTKGIRGGATTRHRGREGVPQLGIADVSMGCVRRCHSLDIGGVRGVVVSGDVAEVRRVRRLIGGRGRTGPTADLEHFILCWTFLHFRRFRELRPDAQV